jgi:hypothetical protein
MGHTRGRQQKNDRKRTKPPKAGVLALHLAYFGVWGPQNTPQFPVALFNVQTTYDGHKTSLQETGGVTTTHLPIFSTTTVTWTRQTPSTEKEIRVRTETCIWRSWCGTFIDKGLLKARHCTCF